MNFSRDMKVLAWSLALLFLCPVGFLVVIASLDVESEESIVESAAPETVQETPVSFAADLMPVFEGDCLACHVAEPPEGRQNGGLLLDTYADLMAASPSVVIPGEPDASALYTLFAPGNPPHADVQLSAEQAALIERWIQEGALDN
jgi:hypothetical protein